MRRTFVSLALAAIVSAIGLAPVSAQTLPNRKAGLWESKTTSTDGNTTAKQCIDEKTDQLAQGAFGAGQACSKRNVAKTDSGWATEVECKIGPISTSGKGTITGDFSSKVRIETVTTLTGLPKEKGPVTRTTVVEATWLGPCEAGQSPGDIIFPDGRVVKVPNLPR